ncbi:hypothetical protein RA267_28265, partial [Pseudomonas syringae pv. tagetis]|uniref:hypothetical protein n=1 Tax=Pseudomonas syringae group genomosp. 7 TaxID=251699 RepID=UPI00376F77A8
CGWWFVLCCFGGGLCGVGCFGGCGGVGGAGCGGFGGGLWCVGGVGFGGFVVGWAGCFVAVWGGGLRLVVGVLCVLVHALYASVLLSFVA